MIKKVVLGLSEIFCSIWLYLFCLFSKKETSDLFWSSLVPDYKQEECGTVNIIVSVEEPLTVQNQILARSFYVLKKEYLREGFYSEVVRLLEKAVYKSPEGNKDCAICYNSEGVVIIDWSIFCECFERVMPSIYN